jgi:quercetin dioxygenase-like cupin family protein
MDLYRLRFDDLEGWESNAPGVRFRRRTNGAAGLRMIEMLSSASHPDWCIVGHSGCVLEGTLEIEFDHEVVRFQAGDGMVIPPGQAHRHRPRAITDRVRIAVVDHPAS